MFRRLYRFLQDIGGVNLRQPAASLGPSLSSRRRMFRGSSASSCIFHPVRTFGRSAAVPYRGSHAPRVRIPWCLRRTCGKQSFLKYDSSCSRFLIRFHREIICRDCVTWWIPAYPGLPLTFNVC